MSDIQIGLLGIACLFALIALRVPIGVALITISFTGLWILFDWNLAWGSIGLIPYQFASSWLLSSVPMFLLMGYICYHAQLTQGLFRAARMWLSAVPGGLAVAAVVGSAGFAAVSGSSVATSAAMGRIAIPEMMRNRYDPELATGSVAVAGTIGALIPPSIIMILYGVIAEVSVTALFLAGITAGLITMFGYIIVILIRVKLNPALAPEPDEPTTWADRFLALKDTWPVVLIMIGVFGGLFGGLFTPTEAGATGAFLACVTAVIKRSLRWEQFKNAILETVLTTAALLIIGIGASLLTRFLALSGTGDFLSTTVLALELDPMMLIIAFAIVYILLGMFMEPIGAMLLTLPIVLPILEPTGFSLIWFGIIVTKLVEIGMITPPIGMNVFVIKSVVRDMVSTTAIFRGIFWFLIMDLFVLALLIAFPRIVLQLPLMAS